MKLSVTQILYIFIISNMIICAHTKIQQQPITLNQYEAIAKIINDRNQVDAKNWKTSQKFIQDLLLPQEIEKSLISISKINALGIDIKNTLLQTEKKQALINLYSIFTQRAYNQMLNAGKQDFSKTLLSNKNVLASIKNAARDQDQFSLKLAFENTRNYIENSLSPDLKQRFGKTKDYMFKTIQDYNLGEKKDKVVQKAGQLWEEGKKKWKENFGQSQDKIVNQLGDMIGKGWVLYLVKNRFYDIREQSVYLSHQNIFISHHLIIYIYLFIKTLIIEQTIFSMSLKTTSINLSSIQMLMLAILLSLFICVNSQAQQQPLTQNQYEAITKVINQRDQENGKSLNQLQQFIKGLLLPQEIQTPLLNFVKINVEGRAIQNYLVELEKKQSEALSALFGAISKKAYYAMLNTGKQAFGKTKQSLGSLLVSISNAAGEQGKFSIKQAFESARSYIANKMENLELKQSFLSTQDFLYKTVEDFHLGEKKDQVFQKAGQLWEQGKKKWNDNFGQSQEMLKNKIGGILSSIFSQDQNKSKEQKPQQLL